MENSVITVEPSSSGVNQMRRRLSERRLGQTDRRRHACIHRVPTSLTGICPDAIEPEMVSIGPYHCGKEKLLEFESYKWRFLDSHLHQGPADLLDKYYRAMENLEERTRNYYSEVISMPDFVIMMVLDGCFIIELFQQMSSLNEFHEGSILLMRPWLIPVITRDLLKLQNQLPFFVLQELYLISENEKHLPVLALQFFSHSWPRPSVIESTVKLREAEHLLDLFRLSFLPNQQIPISMKDPLPQKSKFDLMYRPSSESIQCTTQLRPSGVKFRPHRDAKSFLDVDFQNGVLQIPPITINDLAIVVFINCMAFEQCHEYVDQRFTAYIAFMSRLINSTRDVTLLCADGIITAFSLNDQNVAEMFTKLREKVVFNIRDCYLSKQFGDVEAYYSSHRATFIRTYFSRPWSFISVLYAFILLLLTVVQTVVAILSHHQAK